MTASGTPATSQRDPVRSGYGGRPADICSIDHTPPPHEWLTSWTVRGCHRRADCCRSGISTVAAAIATGASAKTLPHPAQVAAPARHLCSVHLRQSAFCQRWFPRQHGWVLAQAWGRGRIDRIAAVRTSHAGVAEEETDDGEATIVASVADALAQPLPGHRVRAG